LENPDDMKILKGSLTSLAS